MKTAIITTAIVSLLFAGMSVPLGCISEDTETAQQTDKQRIEWFATQTFNDLKERYQGSGHTTICYDSPRTFHALYTQMPEGVTPEKMCDASLTQFGKGDNIFARRTSGHTLTLSFDDDEPVICHVTYLRDKHGFLREYFSFDVRN